MPSPAAHPRGSRVLINFIHRKKRGAGGSSSALCTFTLHTLASLLLLMPFPTPAIWIHVYHALPLHAGSKLPLATATSPGQDLPNYSAPSDSLRSGCILATHLHL